MSAVMSDPVWAREVRIKLPPSDEMPRELWIGWDRYGLSSTHVHCQVFLADGRRIAYAGAHEPADVSLKYEKGRGPQLWLRRAQFDLTKLEAAEVERAFAPLGLKVERNS